MNANTGKTLDEVVATNLRRVRKERGLSVEQLADLLWVGKHQVYDMESPRDGRPQRKFLWSELVALCETLDVTLLDLVLPEPERRLLIESRHPKTDLSTATHRDRDWLATQIVGFALDSESLDTMRSHTKKRQAEKDRFRRELPRIVEELRGIFHELQEEE